MNILFQRIINCYQNRRYNYTISEADYNLLPYIFRVKDHNDLALSQEYAQECIKLPARANAKNLKFAERMRRYASYRTTC